MPGNQANADNDTVSLAISASDQTGAALSYTATGLPPGLAIDPTSGQISGTIGWTADTGSPYSVTVTATDSSGYSGSASFTWTVSYYDQVSVTNPGNQTNADNDTVSLPISATDQTGAALSYTATGLPPGLAIDPTSGQISGTISWTADTGSPYSVTVTATDSSGYSGSASFTWTVSYYDQVSVTNPGNQTNADNDTVSLPISASDQTGAALSYTATGLPPGLAIDPTSGLISGTIGWTADTGSPYSVTVTATDSSGYSGSASFTWTVSYYDEVSVTNPGKQTNADNDTVSLPISASDQTGAALSYTATGLPPG